MPRIMTVAATVAVALLVTAGPTLAHARLLSSTPAAGTTVAEAPAEVVLEFNERVASELNQLQVRDPDGERVDAGAPETVGERVRVDLRAIEVAGTYDVAYRIVSADGHPVEGTFTFTVAEDAVAPEPTAEPTAEPTDADRPVPTEGPADAPATEPAPAPTPGTAPATPDDGERAAGIGLLPVALLGGIVVLAVGGGLLLRRRD